MEKYTWLVFFSFNFNLRLKKRKKISKLKSLKANLLIDYIPRNIVSEKKKKTDSMDLNSKTFFLKYRVDNASYQKNFQTLQLDSFLKEIIFNFIFNSYDYFETV